MTGYNREHQLNIDNQSPDESADIIGERIDALARDYRSDPEKLREAEEWVAGGFEDDHYSAVTLALHQLHYTDPSALAGSDLLTTLYRLAKVEAAAMDAKLLEMATDDVMTELGVEE